MKIISRQCVVCILSIVFLASCTTKPATPANSADMLANIDPFTVSVVTVNMNNFWADDIKTKDIECQFDPKTNTVLLLFKFQGSKNIWSFTEKNRVLIIDALSRYEADFTSKNLIKTGKRLAEYGFATAFIKWGVIALNSQATPKLPLGYNFIDSSPYFSITLQVTPNDLYEISGKSTARSSPYICLYMTRAQAAAFGEMLSQDFLLKKLAEQNVPAHLLPEGQILLNSPDQY